MITEKFNTNFVALTQSIQYINDPCCNPIVLARILFILRKLQYVHRTLPYWNPICLS